MKSASKAALLVASGLILGLSMPGVGATTRYVWPQSPGHASPFTNWATAATTIQEAVDVAQAGDTILVTNGVYATGGKAVFGLMTNRVVLNGAFRLESVNGPSVTAIEGAAANGGSNGVGAIRCVYLGANAVLSGFTLTNGHTQASGDADQEQGGGGVWSASTSGVVTNCVLAGNSAAQHGGGASHGTVLYDCSLRGNTALTGGGTAASRLYHCTLTGNSAQAGGGTYVGSLSSCSLSSNSADDGGGSYGGTLSSCTLIGNSARLAGGAHYSSMIGCTVSSNSATIGGGANQCVLSSCRVIGNRAADTGGGAYAGTLSNCTLTGNSALRGGGVAAPADFDGTILYNCIVFHNTASSGSNYPTGSRILFRYSCAAPLPPGPGNIEAEPQMTSDAHLFSSSPCIGAGSAAYSSGVDIDGEAWADPPCIGADQVVPGNLFGPIDLSILPGYETLVVNYAGSFTGIVAGRVAAVVWDFGDGTILSNQLHTSHAWTAPGIYTVRLTGYNDSFPAGFSTNLAITVIDGVYHVNQHNLNPVAPYASWETAATNIQDAIGAALPGRRLVLVTNGVYRVGTVNAIGLNRVALTNGIVVRSVNGPTVTVIDGESNGVRCAYLEKGTVLSGFTLRGGQAERGGGAWCEESGVLSNCVLTGNSAGEGGGAIAGVLYNCTLSNNWAAVGGAAAFCVLSNSVLIGNSAEEGGGASACDVYNCALRMNLANSDGGGAFVSRLYNCTLTGNLSAGFGGGAESTSLFNCTLTGNSANLGGATIDSTLYNCIAYFNSSSTGDELLDSSCSYSCTSVLLPGEGNITNEPAFMNAAAGDFRLSPASPCINAGRNVHSFGSTDLESLPRIAGDTVDMGAYEFQHPTSRLSYAWLQQYGMPTDGSADDADPDFDHFNNWQEWRAGTCPTNALSLLRLYRSLPGPAGVAVSWQSVNNRSYFLDRSTNLGGVFLPWKSNLVGQAGTTTVLDAGPAIGAVLYRVGVQE